MRRESSEAELHILADLGHQPRATRPGGAELNARENTESTARQYALAAAVAGKGGRRIELHGPYVYLAVRSGQRSRLVVYIGQSSLAQSLVRLLALAGQSHQDARMPRRSGEPHRCSGGRTAACFAEYEKEMNTPFPFEDGSITFRQVFRRQAERLAAHLTRGEPYESFRLPC